jgi:hypothetical protein
MRDYPATQMQARVCFTFILGLNLLIVEDPTVTVKCGTAIKALFSIKTKNKYQQFLFNGKIFF